MRTAMLSLAVFIAMGASACGPADGGEGDGPVGAAPQAQIDSGDKDYLIYTLSSSTGQIGKVLVTATAGGGYAANREYWYLTTNPSNSSALTISGGTSQYWTNPPSGLGTLSFTTSRIPTWASGTSRGTMLVYSNALTGEYDAINWGMSNSGGTWTGSITWWHDSTGYLFGDSVSRTLSPTSTSGTHYFFTSTPL